MYEYVCMYCMYIYIYVKCKLFMHFIFQKRKRTEFSNFIQFSVMKLKRKTWDQNLPSDICRKLPVNIDRSQTHLSEDSISPLVCKCKYFMQN